MPKLIVQIIFSIAFFSLLSSSCRENKTVVTKLKTGSEQTEKYIPLLVDENIAVVANQTSLIGKVHLVDSLISLGIDVKRIFGPEHGFRGTGDAGEKIKNNIDLKTNLPVVSLHGKYKKPRKEDLQDIDVIVFDIQDVGVRFYTYISTLQYVMEACAENNLELLILDRPNPNGFYVDGPILDTVCRSFLGLNPIPLVHGMTIGEMAQMINGEGWLISGIKCKMSIISCKNYDHNTLYILPEKPSPNLPTMASVYLYPSLGLFEGTVVSVGRGTNHPFEMLGHPEMKNGDYQFTPISIPGASKYPKFEGEECNGFFLGNKVALKVLEDKQINLEWLINSHQYLGDHGIDLFNKYFTHHAGNQLLQNQIEEGLSAKDIRKSWDKDLNEFKKLRKKYLLYTDFE